MAECAALSENFEYVMHDKQARVFIQPSLGQALELLNTIDEFMIILSMYHFPQKLRGHKLPSCTSSWFFIHSKTIKTSVS